MNDQQIIWWRYVLGRVGAICGVLLVFILVDGLVAQFMAGANNLAALPGDTLDINGPLPEKVSQLEKLSYISSSGHLSVTFVELQKGYWLGGSLWRGRLVVSPEAVPGGYDVAVVPQGEKVALPPNVFHVVVYADAHSLRLSSRSWLKRVLGLSPWLAAILVAPFFLGSLAAVFWLSRRLEEIMAFAGRAEIYRVTRGQGVVEIAFGLGSRHGLKAGDQVRVLNEQGLLLGTAEVQEVFDNDALAFFYGSEDVRPGYMVVRG